MLDAIQCNHRETNLGCDRYLVTAQNKLVKEHIFRSNFARELSQKIMDPQRADFISDQLDKIIIPTALGHYGGENMIHEWKEALKYYSNLLGNDSNHMLKTFRESAHEDVKKFIDAYPQQSKHFFDSLAQRETKLNAGMDLKSKKVVILDSSSGGGHVTTANAIKSLMEKRGYQAIILNQDELDKENDPLKVAGVRYKGEEITMAEVYNRVFQQDNDLTKANKLWEIGDGIRKFVPSTELRTLTEKVRSIHPEMIFSVATHHQEHAGLSNITGVPLKYVHTDYDFNNALLPIAEKVDPKRIGFWINANDPEILQGKKIGNWEVPLQKLKDKGVIQVCGFPVRPSFVREADPKKINALKKKYGIDPNHSVAVLSMGRQGIRDHILKYLQLMQNPSNHYDKPMHLIVVCGKNEALKKDLETYQQQLPAHEKHPQFKVQVEGLVEENKMADFYKVADALISKPGGASSAETVEMGVPILSCDPHIWELPNQNHLQRHNLAEPLQSDWTFMDQLKNVFRMSNKAQAFKPIDWKKTMGKLIDEAIKTPVSAAKSVVRSAKKKVAKAKKVVAQKVAKKPKAQASHKKVEHSKHHLHKLAARKLRHALVRA